MFTFFTSGRATSRPIELYVFTYGPSPADVAAYTDAEFEVVSGVTPFAPIPIERDIVSNSGTIDRSPMEIRLPRDQLVARLFEIYPPSHSVAVSIYQGEADDPDAEFIPFWHGRVLSCAWEGVRAKLHCEPISTAIGRVGLRRNFQVLCPHMVYGPQCGANRAAGTESVIVSAVVGEIITLNSLLTNSARWAGGWFEYTADGRLNTRTIHQVATVGGVTQFRVNGVPLGLEVGAQADAIRGCRRTMQACIEDHANIGAYGGHPWIPLSNPIGGTSPYI